MRSRRRSGPLPHVLVAGDVAEVDSVRALLALVSPTTYGQVYLEVDEGAPLPEVPRPARVGLTAIVRASADRPGDRLSEAVAAWGEEWMVEVPHPARDVSVWVGSTVRAVTPELAGLLDRL